MSARQYVLSEQVCLQCLIVNLKGSGWMEWFSNPTAGPWKKMRIPGAPESEEMRFRKEVDRPDLIMCEPLRQVILVLEAKDNPQDLISGTQIRKSVRVFKDVFRRIKTILETSGNIVHMSLSEALLLCGYLFPSVSDAAEITHLLRELESLHVRECEVLSEQSLIPHIRFMVSRNSEDDLSVTFSLARCTESTSRRCAETLGTKIFELATPRH